jgi:cytochrome c oxidase assembly protein subunit 15
MSSPALISTPTRARIALPLVLFAWFTLVFNVLVALWGVVVRATDSGNGCGNHWPLCNGQVLPTLANWHTQIEFIHRMSVGVGFTAIVVLLVWTLKGTVPWHLARKAAVFSLVFALIESVLGALLVELGYVGQNHSFGRVVLLSIHLTNTMMLLGSLAMTTGLLTHNQDKGEIVVSRAEGVWLFVGMLSTLIVAVSGSLAALGDTLFPAPTFAAAMQQDFAASSPWLLQLRWTHPALAMVSAGFIFWITIRALTTQGTTFAIRKNRIFSGVVIGLLSYQFAIGLVDVISLAPMTLQVLHLFGADLLWISLVLLVAGVAMPQGEVCTKPR